MTDRLTVVYRFTNATLVNWAPNINRDSITVLDEQEPLPKLPELLNEEVLRQLGQYYHTVYRKAWGAIELVSITSTQEVVSYLPLDATSGLRELQEEDYEKLTPGFQKLYKKKLSEPTMVRTVVEHEIREVPFELQDDVLSGKVFPTKLHELISPIREHIRKRNSSYYNDRDGIHVELRNNLSIQLSDEELLKLISERGPKFTLGKNYGASAEYKSGYRDPSELEITFFTAPYRGETRKIFDKKANGQHYADGRGRLVKDLPSTAGTATISEKDVGLWWYSIGGDVLSEDEKLEALEVFAKSLWLLSERGE